MSTDLFRILLTAAVASLSVSGIAPAAAQGFSALASPPRFELSAAPGTRSRQAVEVTNTSALPSKYRFRTADWALGSDGSVTFYDELRPGSCRPWVMIERNELSLAGGARIRYRFEVAPPADAPAGECRFALMIEGDETVMANAGAFQIPVRGRLGVIVYVTVGDAAPKLEIVKAGYDTINGQRTPALWVRNSGNAHGRLAGFLSGTDAKGRDIEFAPSNFPILPGETRPIALSAQTAPNQAVEPALPVTVRGTLEWSGGRLAIEHRFE